MTKNEEKERERGKVKVIKEQSSKTKPEKWLSISNTGHSRGNGEQQQRSYFLTLAPAYSCPDPQFCN